jgi:hypothetical protein
VKARYAVTAFVYAVALMVGALVVSGQAGLKPFSSSHDQVQALTGESQGSPILLCDGCFYSTPGQVTTFTINFGQGNNSVCCFQTQPVHYQQPSFWNSCDIYGCANNQYLQPSYQYQQPVYTNYSNNYWSLYPPASYNQYWNYNTPMHYNQYWNNYSVSPTYHNQYWNTYSYSQPVGGYWSLWP